MGQPLRVILLEDRPEDAELELRELRRAGYDPAWQRVDNESDYLAALAGHPELIIADYNLPSFSGQQALALLAERGLDVPFIVVSGSIGEELAVKMTQAGAADYLLKDRLARLGPSIATALEQQKLRADHRRAEQALAHQNKRFRALVENSVDGIVLLDAAGSVLYASPAIERIIGNPVTRWLERIHPVDAANAADVFAQLVATPGSTASLDYRYKHRDGSWIWLETTGSNMLAEPGIEAIVGNIRDVTARKQSQEALQRRVAELSALFETTSALTIEEEPQVLLELIVTSARQLLNAHAGGINLYDAATNELTAVVLQSLPMPPSTRMQYGQGMVGRVAESRQALIVDDYQTWPGRAPAWEAAPIAAGMAVPMVYRGELVGVLSLLELSPSGRQFTAADTQLLSLFAGQAAAVVHNARLLADTQRQLSYLQTLRTIDLAISGSFDLNVTLNFLLDEAATQLKVDAVDVLLLNPHTHLLEFRAGQGFRTSALQHTRLRLGEGHAGRAALTNGMVQVPDLSKALGELGRSPQLPGEEFTSYYAAPMTVHNESITSREGFMAYYATPLATKGRVTGVLEVFHRTPLHPDQQWLDFLETLAAQTAIAIDNYVLFNGLERKTQELKLAYDTTLEGWSRALDLRDKETEGHTVRVTEVTLRLAAVMGLHDEELEHIRRGALLHDIGKMGIPDSILLKPGPLTTDEWALMRKHPDYAYELLLPIAFLKWALDIPYCHHEKWDGSGYPRGLKGEQIPLAARLFAVVDVWDALRSDRPYRLAWPEDKVRAHIRSEAGSHFDPKVVDVFLSLGL